MRLEEIVIATLLAVVCAAAVVLIDTPIRRFWKRTLVFLNWWRVTKQTGLVAVYPRTSEFAPRKLKEILETAKQHDTVLLAARTNLSVLKGFAPESLGALSRGVTLKFLLFDSRAFDPTNRWSGPLVFHLATKRLSSR